jgi:hypothetical protein
MHQQPASRWTTDLDRHLRQLLTGGHLGLDAGAELEVRDPAGQVVFLAPLARHHRVDETGTLWVRPVVGGPTPDRDTPARLPDTVDPDTVDPDTFDPDTVDPDTVDPDTVDPDTVDPDTFDPDTVDPDTFDPDVARRRGLAATKVRRVNDELIVDLRSGEQARIRPARPALLAELQRWDTWVTVALTAEQEADLDTLAHDPP